MPRVLAGTSVFLYAWPRIALDVVPFAVVLGSVRRRDDPLAGPANLARARVRHRHQRRDALLKSVVESSTRLHRLHRRPRRRPHGQSVGLEAVRRSKGGLIGVPISDFVPDLIGSVLARHAGRRRFRAQRAHACRGMCSRSKSRSAGSPPRKAIVHGHRSRHQRAQSAAARPRASGYARSVDRLPNRTALMKHLELCSRNAAAGARGRCSCSTSVDSKK